MVGFGEAIGLFYKNYVNFEGRATRAEYWWPTLMQTVVYTSLFVTFFSAGGFEETGSVPGSDLASLAIMGGGALFYLINFFPRVTVKARRFHDLGQTGWLVLVFWAVNIFVPLAEFARMIWFAFLGTGGTNQYGLDPHGYDADIFG